LPNTAHTPGWLKFFRPKVDFFELLRQQADSTLGGAVGFKDWLATGAKCQCETVHELEHRADTQKLDIERKLAETVVTPFDREEIYDISARLDLIINGLKKTVKDMEFLHVEVDDTMKAMADVLADGVRLVCCAIDNLEKDLKQAEQAANESRKTETSVAEIYRHAMKELYEGKDFELLMRKKEVYDSLTIVSRRVESVGEKLLHLSIKMA
jgi:uncharacterized protein Yka (UPF0111/DUF47 family)